MITDTSGTIGGQWFTYQPQRTDLACTVAFGVSQDTENYIQLIHTNGFNVAFYDGHAKWQSHSTPYQWYLNKTAANAAGYTAQY
jgi:prepilin-type processing-associated H-X9-DG protein